MVSFIITAVLGIVMIFADQFTKYLVSIKIEYPYGSVNVIDNFFCLSNCHNTGAAWSAFSNATLALAIFSTVLAAVILFFYVQTKPAFLKLSLALLISGAIGNVIDRFRLGYVVDFLNFYNLFGYSFPVFNVADICVCSGCIGMLIYIAFLSKKRPPFREGSLAEKLYGKL